MAKSLIDTNILGYEPLITPRELSALYPSTDKIKEFVRQGREQVENILDRKDKRKLIIIGPCSIHNVDEAIEYAHQIAELSEKVKDKFLILMRTYFEKPRTCVGWEGLINDPYLDDSCEINYGLELSRKLLLDISNLGVLCATEFVDRDTPQYIGDLISWGAIGARTTASPTHKKMASGISSPIGYKNLTSGDVKTAVNSIKASQFPHSFKGNDYDGRGSKVFSKGNKYCHLVLRGGESSPNYSPEDIKNAVEQMEKEGLTPNILIDCSHQNSRKDYRNQKIVFNSGLEQILQGNQNIIGWMIESNLKEGSQDIGDGKNLEYGKSITDGCSPIKEDKILILNAYEKL